MENTIFPA